METIVQQVIGIIEMAREGEIDNDLRSIRHRVQQLATSEKQNHNLTWGKAVETVHGTSLPEFNDFEDYFNNTYK